MSERWWEPRVMRSPKGRLRSRARGAFLLEALVGMLIFAVAAASAVALVASAVRAGTDADLRSAATALAAATLARMATDDFETLAERYEASRDGAGYRALATRARLLPGVTTSVNLPSLSITDGPSISSRRVDVVVSWQPPGAARAHRASMTTVIAR